MNIPLPRIHLDFVKPNRSCAFLTSLLLVGFIALLDHLTGSEVSLSFFYLIPVAFATWYLDHRAGYLVIGLSLCAFTFSTWAGSGTYSWEMIRYWNGFMQLAIFILIIWLLQEFKRALAHQRMLDQTDFL